MKEKKKKKIRIERKLLRLRQKFAHARLLELIMILCQANEIFIVYKETLIAIEHVTKNHVNECFIVHKCPDKHFGKNRVVIIHLQKHVFMKVISKATLLEMEIRKYIGAMTVSYSSLTSTEMSIFSYSSFLPSFTLSLRINEGMRLWGKVRKKKSFTLFMVMRLLFLYEDITF